MKHLKVYEDLSMGDPTYGNSVFKIRYRSVNDLSNKKGSDIIDKPINDLLDGIEVGDAITGLGVQDEKPHTGNVVAIKKDEKGENVSVEIEEDGVVLKLAVGSVKFATNGDKGNVTDKKGKATDTGNIDYTFGGYDNFQPTTYESKIQPLSSFMVEAVAPKFTFKTDKPTGKWRSFSNETHDIKLKGKLVGHIGHEKPFKISLMVMKTDADKNPDKNPNCPWKWIHLKKESNSLQEAKDYVNSIIDKILSQFTLNMQ